MEKAQSSFRIAAVPGSVRSGNFTSKALGLVLDEIRKHADIGVDVIDPAAMALPLPGMADGSPATRALVEKVSAATGVVLATPEYHGSYSSVMKLVIENLGFPSVLAGKPVALLGVAAGQIGAIKALEHLRSVCSHVGAIVLPGSVSIAGVQHMFDEADQCLDATIETRIRSVATSLIDYIRSYTCPRVVLEEMVRRGSAFQWAPVESRS